jgi:dTDP-4-amino-4,6-dideoxygalactose transaminase/nucleoside-diphosphate-sugar epimerase
MAAQKKKVLVIGGAGYVGSSLTRRLLAAGHHVTVLDALLFGGDAIAPLLGEPNFEFHHADVRDVKKLAELMPGHNAVCLLAAIVGEPACNRDPQLAVEVNLHGARNALAAAKQAGVERFLFASTCSNYGVTNGDELVTEETRLQPISTYSETKVTAEQEILAAADERFHPTVLRFSTAFGISARMRFDLLVSDFTLAAVRDRKVVIYGEQFWRPFVHVRDIADCMERVMNADASLVSGEVFNVGGNDLNVSKLELGTKVQQQVAGTDLEFVKQGSDPRSYRVDFTKIRKLLGFVPQWSIDDGVRELQAALQAGVWQDPTEARYYNVPPKKAEPKSTPAPTEAHASNGKSGSAPSSPGAAPESAQRQYLLSDCDIGENEALAVADVVRSKWLSVGPQTAKFEKQFAEFLGCEHAVAVSSCTAALHIALSSLGIGPGDEVIVPSYTFSASVNSILYQGATPVFVEINGEHDLNLSVDDLASKISSRTKAIMVVHLAGYAVDMARVMSLAERHGLYVIEDACHAIGATYTHPGAGKYLGRKLGTIGHLGCFSFFANKNMVTGEGGMLVTNDANLAADARALRSHGMTKTSWDKAKGRADDYDLTRLGYNYRSTELTAALGLVQLQKLSTNNGRRAELAKLYQARLAGVPGLTIPFADRNDDSAHHIFPIVLGEREWRCVFRQNLKARGIQTSVHYPPVHLFSLYRGLLPEQASLGMTEDVAAREVTLPLHSLLASNDIDSICDAVEQSLASMTTLKFVEA